MARPVDVVLSRDKGGETRTVTAWIDTAFNGGLVLPNDVIVEMGLQEASSTPAVLADGRTVDLVTYSVHVNWFGREYRTQVIGNDGALPLLGTILLADRELLINYRDGTVQLN